MLLRNRSTFLARRDCRNIVMRDFDQRLVSHNTRPGKVPLTAVMRKLLVTLNAIARDNQPWAYSDT
ncbi:MAG: hypothetical protein B7Y12_05155 [Rhizobiales bacterium 24-66-13]|jgi:transposase|nr:MAG: hypothetical protein B7Y61_03390 [Rhizobiales bacterium 35-66-30]OYZ82023.1 MAG: hypothetical protein B7Y12_05155 [Rhizobiales bacterium 24-66-13]OZB11003.1 MAG: hypothetical protein B7X67_05650 [Rhizobiales bacterium 39-66-18]